MKAIARRYSAWIWLVSAVVIVVGLKIAGQAGRPGGSPLSVRNSTAAGALASYLWLEKLGYRVRRETAPDLGLSRMAPGRDVLVIVEQDLSITNADARKALTWVERGGRLVLATDGSMGRALIDVLGGKVVALGAPRVQVVQPLLMSPPVARLAGGAEVGITVPGASTAAAADGAPVVLRVSRGRGVVWLLSAPAMASNGAIANDDNRRLLLNLVGPARGVVGFDEYTGSSAGSGATSGWFNGSEWGAAVLFVTLTLVLYRWLSGWRLGPPVVPLAETHRPLAEYVVSLAGLMSRARRREDVLHLYQRRLERRLHERFGSLHPAKLAGDRGRDLGRLLAREQRITSEELLQRAAEIARYEDELRRSGG